MNGVITLHVLPRQTMTWDYFLANTPRNSIGLDGVISGREGVDKDGKKIILPLGPAYDFASRHVNYDHHEGVVRSATMSTAKQVYFDIKSGLFVSFLDNGRPHAHVYVNDPDQDTSLAVALLDGYKMIEGTNSNPSLNRLLDINDKLDISGGAFPLNLNDKLVRQHNWIFEPYTSLRKSGALATADAAAIANCIESIVARLQDCLMGRGGEIALDTRHEMLYDGEHFRVVRETGGNDARYYLFSQGMNAYISIVAVRPDGKLVCSIGKSGRWIPFDVQGMYDVFNGLEGLTGETGWNGSDLVGGSSRALGTGLDWQVMRDATLEHHKKIGYW